MESIDKTMQNKKKQNQYKYGDILKCWYNNENGYDLYQISNTPEMHRFGAILIHECEEKMDRVWSTVYDSTTDLVNELKGTYDHVIKVKAHIVIDKVLCEESSNKTYEDN